MKQRAKEHRILEPVSLKREDSTERTHSVFDFNPPKVETKSQKRKSPFAIKNSTPLKNEQSNQEDKTVLPT